MRWIADECIAARLVVSLRTAGHDVLYAAERFPSTEDVDVLERALNEQRLLLTEDKDFGDLIFGASAQKSMGVVMLRIRDELAYMAWPRVQAAIGQLGERLFGAFTVIEESRLRTRLLGDRQTQPG